MNVYIWHRLEQVTGNYHPEAGVAVVAEDEATARQLVEDARPERDDYGDDFGPMEWPDAPDAVIPVHPDHDGHGHALWIFPDAGCC